MSVEGFGGYFCNLTSNLYNGTMFPALLGLTAAAAASAAGYQSMSPTGQWYGRTLTGGAPGAKQIALTYDDGPNDPHTLKLLEVLAKHGVRATFFMIGRYVRERPDIAGAVAQAGHAIGNHTFTHPLLIFKSVEETRKQLIDCSQALTDAIGPHSNLFRPPFGGRRPATLNVARELGLQTVMWNVTGYDWNAPPAAVIEEKVARQMRGGDVILLHDGGHKAMGADRAQTVMATENLLRRFRGLGYEFVTADGMGVVSAQVAMDDLTRNEIAECLERLAGQAIWNAELWQRCYDLVKANLNDELLAYIHDDLIHYTGRSLFRSEPRPADLQTYSQEFRDIAAALRSRMSLTDFKKYYE
jgi:peptidoglycan/xylan/chitin deacetylase (PgdA/CDA1 family)